MAKRKNSNKNSNTNKPKSLRLKDITPLTQNQERVFDEFENEKNLILIGCAGTGKTFLGMFLALTEVLAGDTAVRKLIIFRNAVPTRDMGFLKGDMEEKAAAYEEPYKQIANELFDCGTAYESLKARRAIEFMTTSYTRGITLDKCIILVDEVQNMTDHEINTIITRMGKDASIIFSGDSRQLDLNERREHSGLGNLLTVMQHFPDDMAIIQFGPDDIVRHPFLKKYLTKRHELGME